MMRTLLMAGVALALVAHSRGVELAEVIAPALQAVQVGIDVCLRATG